MSLRNRYDDQQIILKIHACIFPELFELLIQGCIKSVLRCNEFGQFSAQPV